jgi:dihydroneopterin aldolase/2-amino-4-hydroxy-6-hydroxymethyldihydropteridine diphosphokinase
MKWDEIHIEGLEIFAHHGVHPSENKEGQTFIINAILYTSLREIGLQDDPNLCTSYGVVCRFINREMQGETYQLIEAVAENLAKKILLRFPDIKELTLEVCKPEAPIGLPFKNVSVKIHRGWHRVYLGLGSNVGERRKTLENAVMALNACPDFRVKQVSSFRRTEPYGGVEQEDFLNGALIGETLLEPEELLDMLQGMERETGRKKGIHWGPRTLDLDILFYDDMIYDSKRLTIPHYDIHNRLFVLEPLAEMEPYLRHPLKKRTMAELLTALQSISSQKPGQQADETAGYGTADE